MKEHNMSLDELAERTIRADILATCPDCNRGSAVWAYQTRGRWPRHWEVICKGCYPVGGFIAKGLTKAEAINQWNTRALSALGGRSQGGEE